MRIAIILLTLLLALPLHAQDALPQHADYVPITPENVSDLIEIPGFDPVFRPEVEWSADGRWLLAGKLLFDTHDLDALPRIMNEAYPFMSLHFLPNDPDRIVASVKDNHGDGDVAVRRVDTGETEQIIQCAEGWLVSPDGSTIIGQHPLTMMQWNLNTGEIVGSVEALRFPLAYTPDGGIILKTDDGTLDFLDLQTDSRDTLLDIGDLKIASFAFSADWTRMAVREIGGAIYVWDIGDRRKTLDFDEYLAWLPPSQNMTAFAFDPDDDTVMAIGDRAGELQQWNLDTGELHPFPIANPHFPKQISSIAYQPGGDLLAVGYSGGFSINGVWKFDIKIEYPAPAVIPLALNFDADSRPIVTVLGANSLRLWDVEANTALPIAPLEIPLDSFPRTDISPDQSLLAVLTEDDQLQLWSLKTGELLFTRPRRATQVRFSPDGTLIATIMPGEAVSLWRVLTPAEINVPNCIAGA